MRNRFRTTGLFLAAMLAGYVGGMISQWTELATAQERPTSQNEVIPPTVNDVIRTTRLELIDKNGVVRGFFGFNDEGSPALMLRDEKAKSRGVFMLMNGQPMLMMIDTADQLRGAFAIKKTGEPLLQLWDATGTSRGVFSVDENKSPGLLLYDNEGKARISVNVAKDGAPCLFVFDAQGKARGSFMVLETGPTLDLYDKAGNTRATLGATSLVNPDTEVETLRPESSLVLFNKDGNVLSKLPY